MIRSQKKLAKLIKVYNYVTNNTEKVLKYFDQSTMYGLLKNEKSKWISSHQEINFQTKFAKNSAHRESPGIMLNMFHLSLLIIGVGIAIILVHACCVKIIKLGV